MAKIIDKQVDKSKTELFLADLQSLNDLPEEWQGAYMASDVWSLEQTAEAIYNEITLESASGAWPENLKTKDFLGVLESYFVPVYVYIGEASGEFSFRMEESWDENIQCKRCGGRGIVKDKDCSRCFGKGTVSERQTNQYSQDVRASSRVATDFVSNSLKSLKCRNQIYATPCKTKAKDFLTDKRVVFANCTNDISREAALISGNAELRNLVAETAKSQLNSGDSIKKNLNANVSVSSESVHPVFVEVLAGHLEYEGERLYIEVCRSTRELNVRFNLPKSVKKGLWKFWTGFFVWHMAVGLFAASQGAY